MGSEPLPARTKYDTDDMTSRQQHPETDRLDEVDWTILAEIQAEGRITNVELARRAGISAPPCLRRLRALEEEGFIKGYRALLDERKLGYEAVCFAMVNLASQAERDLLAFEERVARMPSVRECWKLSGDIDFMLKCIASDLPGFQAIVAELTALPNLKNVRTAIALERVKDLPIVPIIGAAVP